MINCFKRDNIPIHITNDDIREALLPIERVVMIVLFINIILILL